MLIDLHHGSEEPFLLIVQQLDISFRLLSGERLCVVMQSSRIGGFVPGLRYAGFGTSLAFLTGRLWHVLKHVPEMRVRVIGRGLGTGSVWWRCLRLGTWSKNVPPGLGTVTDRVVVRAS